LAHTVGMTSKDIALTFGVAPTTICDYFKRRSWAQQKAPGAHALNAEGQRRERAERSQFVI
jgi:uncharacterized protein YjcR